MFLFSTKKVQHLPPERAGQRCGAAPISESESNGQYTDEELHAGNLPYTYSSQEAVPFS